MTKGLSYQTPLTEAELARIAKAKSSARWQRIRRMQLRRHPLCRFCLERRGKLEPAVVADHVVPHRGNMNRFWTGMLQSLCEECHNRTKRLEEISAWKEIGKDGWPVDPSHPANKAQ